MRDPVNCDKQLLWAALSLAKKDPHGEGLTRSSSESDYLEIVLPGRSAASPVQSPSGAWGSGLGAPARRSPRASAPVHADQGLISLGHSGSHRKEDLHRD